jgi:hypothetical protein
LRIAGRNLLPTTRVDATRQPNHLATMPSSSPSSRRWSTLFLLVSFFVAALHHLPTVRAQFNEADCLSCVGDYEDAFNFTTAKIYCEVGEIGSGTYKCISHQDSLCSGNENATHTYDWSCDPDLFAGAAAAVVGLAFGVIICYYCCGAVVVLAIVGGIIACVVCCCLRGSNHQIVNNSTPVPQVMVLPVPIATSSDTTTMMMTANAAVLPAQTGLAGGMDSPYHQPSYDNSKAY